MPHTASLAVRSILYQRGLYPAESFERVSAHGMTMLVASHPGLRSYLDAVLRQLTGTRLRAGAAPRACLYSLAH